MMWLRLMWLIVTLPCLSSSGTNEKEALMHPNTAYVEAGSSMKVTCSVQEKGIDQGLTSSNLAFSWYKRKHLTPIDANYVTQYNSTTVTLLYPNVSVKRRRSHLWCHRHGAKKKLDAVYVLVGYKPHPSHIMSVSVDNWQNLTITWNKSINHIFKSIPKAYWKIKNESSYHLCPNQHNGGTLYSCWTPLNDTFLDRYTYFMVKINCSNVLGNITTRPEMETFYLANINKPQSVQRLAVLRKGRDWVELSWGSAVPRARNMSYAINASCRKSEQTQVPTTSERTIIWNITGLQPGTPCWIMVATRSEHGQIWSDWERIYETTNDSVPIGFPVITHGGFDIRILVPKRKMIVYWQPMSNELRGGNITKYKITLRSKHNSTLTEVLSQKCCDHETELEMNEAYNISITASTSAGYNENPHQQVVILPQTALQSLSPVNVTAMVTDSNAIEVRWSLKKGIEYTGYWCRLSSSNDARHCEGTVRWVKGISSPWTVNSLPISNDPHQPRDLQRFRFGVSSYMDTNSSGINWSDCVYNLARKSLAPRVQIMTTSSSGFSLRLTLPLKCSDRPGFIYAFKVTYCKLDGSPCVEATVACTGMDTLWDQYGLPGDTVYRLTVQSITAAGLSPNPETNTITTLTGVSDLFTRHITGILIGCFVGLVFLVIGVISCFWKCRRKYRLYEEKLKVPIVLPEQPQPEVENGNAVLYHNIISKSEGNKNDITQYGIPPLQSVGAQDVDDSGVASLCNNGSSGSGLPAMSSSGIQMPSSLLLLSLLSFSGSEPRKFNIVDEIIEQNEQNKINTEHDDDYNYMPTRIMDNLDGKKPWINRHFPEHLESGSSKPQEEVGLTRSRSSSSEDMSCSCSSGDDGDVYKRAGVLDNPRMLHPSLHPSSEEEAVDGEEDQDDHDKESNYGYRPAEFSDDCWPLHDKHSLSDCNRGSSPLLGHLPHGTRPPLNQPKSPGRVIDGMASGSEPGKPVPPFLFNSELLPMADCMWSGSELMVGSDQAPVTGDSSEDGENSDDYGYAPSQIMVSPM